MSINLFSASNALRAVTSFQPVSRVFLDPAVTGQFFIDVRGKKTKGGGTTRNQAGSPKGKKWGLKVYDGQRVPSGTQLLTQNQLRTMPGWNVRVNAKKTIVAECTGRVMLTTELMDPNFDNELVSSALPAALKPDQKIFKQYLHIIPDRQHQIFKLVDQV